MSKKTFVIFIICFIFIGELFIRMTDSFHILEESRIVKISIAIDSTNELKLLQKKQIDLSDSSLRILILGDSYIHGGGISPDKKISRRLKTIIKKNCIKYKKTYVLDVSQPNSNNLDNMNAYFKYKAEFLPQIVVLGYHYNDINGNLNEVNKLSEPLKFKPDLEKKIAGSRSKMAIRKITDFLYNSAILNYMMPRLNNTILNMGYIIPKSRLYNTIEYYKSNNETWKKSKQFLTRVLTDGHNSNTYFIVYHFAYTNLIEYPELFEETNDKIERFFESFENTTYISGIEHFRGKKASDYYINRHDGHPNAAAHFLISKKINDYIIEYTAYDTQ